VPRRKTNEIERPDSARHKIGGASGCEKYFRTPKTQREKMKKFFSCIISTLLLSSCLFGWSLPGTLTVTCTPQGYSGTSGTWEVVVLCPDGTRISSGSIDQSVTDTVSFDVAPISEGFLEVGSYTIELKSNVVDPINPFLSSLSVQCTSTLFSWDPVIFKNFSVLNEGENTLISYIVPQPYFY
jgi:hypothetical protein